MNDSDEKFIKPCLIIPDIPADFDPNAVPQSGEEYLMKMAYERKFLPVVSFLPGHNEKDANVNEEVPQTDEIPDQVSSDCQYANNAN